MKNRVKLTITIDTEKELTEKEIAEAMIYMKFRLEGGFSTIRPEFLIDSDIQIDKHYFVTTLNAGPIPANLPDKKTDDYE
jgi:hypothetical protein